MISSWSTFNVPSPKRKGKLCWSWSKTTNTWNIPMDEYLGTFWKRKLNLSQDEEWKQVQNALLCATGPLCGLWSQIQKQELDNESGTIPASAVLDMIQWTLVFLGNANHLLSEKRRLGLLDPNLAKYAKGEFPEAGKDLFGSKFAKKIVGDVEADTAICIVNKGFISTSLKGKSPSSSKSDFFWWGQTGGHGTASGRSSFSLCNKSTTFWGQGRGRYNLQL